jgi:hypothetical protein
LVSDPFMAIVQTSASEYGVFHTVVQLAVGWITKLPTSILWHISEKQWSCLILHASVRF